MKTPKLFVGTLISSALAIPVDASGNLATKMEACYRAHGKLMDKPALKNARACWNAHKHLMREGS